MFTSDLIKRALDEDLGSGDLTTEALVSSSLQGVGKILAKEDLVVAGLGVAGGVFVTVDPTLKVLQTTKDGDRVQIGMCVMEVKGKFCSILKAERTALNFLQRLSGIATLTHQFVARMEGTQTKILDTRKTNPVQRHLDKYAVRMGGGVNHRFGLYDAILIKDNHIASIGGSIKEAVQRVRSKCPGREVTVEVSRLNQIEEAIAAGATRLLLDNMNNDAIRESLKIIAKRVASEASGNMTLERVGQVANLGVDYISVGALTHSPKAADLSLEITPQ